MRAITYSIIENLGHCQKDQIRLYYDFLKPNEIGELKSKGIKLGNFFFFFNLQKTKYFRKILINVFYSNNLESYLEKNFYKVSREKLNKRKINIYRKMGFYLIKISNDYYFVYFEYLEKLIKKKFYYIKKKIKISNYENLLEKNIFKTKSKIIFSN